jgi:hypothetical protein
MQMRSAYECWTWERCREQILSLKNRLGFGDRLWILGFELLDDGRLVDRYHQVKVFNPARAVSTAGVPCQHSPAPEIFCILYRYAAAYELPPAGELISLAALDPIRRPGLSPGDCSMLLGYASRDLSALGAALQVPFFGETLNAGDWAFEVRPLPRVPVTFILWRGDEEVSDSGSLLFDLSAQSYLPNLLAELGRLAVWRLKNILDPSTRWGYLQDAG